MNATHNEPMPLQSNRSSTGGSMEWSDLDLTSYTRSTVQSPMPRSTRKARPPAVNFTNNNGMPPPITSTGSESNRSRERPYSKWASSYRPPKSQLPMPLQSRRSSVRSSMERPDLDFTSSTASYRPPMSQTPVPHSITTAPSPPVADKKMTTTDSAAYHFTGAQQQSSII